MAVPAQVGWAPRLQVPKHDQRSMKCGQEQEHSLLPPPQAPIQSGSSMQAELCASHADRAPAFRTWGRSRDRERRRCRRTHPPCDAVVGTIGANLQCSDRVSVTAERAGFIWQR